MFKSYFHMHEISINMHLNLNDYNSHEIASHKCLPANAIRAWTQRVHVESWPIPSGAKIRLLWGHTCTRGTTHFVRAWSNGQLGHLQRTGPFMGPKLSDYVSMGWLRTPKGSLSDWVRGEPNSPDAFIARPTTMNDPTARHTTWSKKILCARPLFHARFPCARTNVSCRLFPTTVALAISNVR
jgi:hypothetical protein